MLFLTLWLACVRDRDKEDKVVFVVIVPSFVWLHSSRSLQSDK